MIHGISAGYARSSNTWANGKRWRRERKNVTRAVFRTIRAISDPNKGKEFLEAKKPWRVLPTLSPHSSSVYPGKGKSFHAGKETCVARRMTFLAGEGAGKNSISAT